MARRYSFGCRWTQTASIVAGEPARRRFADTPERTIYSVKV